MKLQNSRQPNPIRYFLLWMVVLCSGGFLFAQDDPLNQPFAFKKHNYSVTEALNEITLRTGYSFIYNSSLIKLGDDVKTNLQPGSLRNVLNALLQDSSLRYTVIDKYIVIAKQKLQRPSSSIVNSPDSIFVLKGRIVDGRDNSPLPYSSVEVTDNNIGIIANEDGCFTLKIPVAMCNSGLYISCLGYQTLKIPIQELGACPVTFPLQRDIVSLQEVIIRNPDPISLLTSAIHKISSNYSTIPCSMTGFYREVIRKNDQYQIVSEAVLNLYKSPYSQAGNDDRIKILKSRKYINHKNLDTILVKIKAGLNACLMLDIVKNTPDFIDERYLSEYNFGMPDIVKFNDELSYVIPFRQKENITGPYLQGDLFIHVNSLAILGANYEVNPSHIENVGDQIITYKKRKYTLTPQRIVYTVAYRNIHNKYYLSHSRFDIAFKLRKRRHLFSKSYHVFFEMATSNIDTVHVKKIPKNEASPINVIFSEAIGKYDEKFWGKENFIQPELPLEQAMVKIAERLNETK